MAQSINVREVYPLLKKAGSKWVDDKAPKMAAALAYNTLTAIAPLLVVALWAFTRWYGSGGAAAKVKLQLASLTDPRVADALTAVIDKLMESVSQKRGYIITGVSLLVSLLGASGVFAELQDSLNTIWGVKPIPGRAIMNVIRDRFFSVVTVFGLAFLLLVSMVVSTLINGMSSSVMSLTIGTDGFTAKTIGVMIELVLSTAVVATMFAGMFWLLPDVTIKWKDVALGGLVTAVLFQIGKYGLSIYLGLVSPGSTFGAVGSIVVMLVWIYYSSYIVFFGAEFTQVYATSFGSKVKISDNAEPADPRDAAAYGLVESDRAKAQKPAPRRRPRMVRPPHESPIGRRVGLTFVPALASATLLRLTIKRYLNAHQPPVPLAELWKDAASKWKDAVLLRKPAETGRRASRDGR